MGNWVSCENLFWGESGGGENKFDTNKDASNKCENERIFLNLLEFT